MDNTKFFNAIEACFPLLGLNNLLDHHEIKEISSGLKMVFSNDCIPTFAYFDSITSNDLFESDPQFEEMAYSITPEVELLMTKENGVMNCIYKY